MPEEEKLPEEEKPGILKTVKMSKNPKIVDQSSVF